MSNPKPVGLTVSVGYQIGVRRSLPASPEQAWKLLTSQKGLQLLLGKADGVSFAAGHSYLTKEGTTGEIRVVKPLEQLRLTWQPKDRPQPSTLQIRLLPGKTGKTTISFHQEKLADEQQREAKKLRWEKVLAAVGSALEVESGL